VNIDPRQIAQITYTVVVLAVLLLGWELFCRSIMHSSFALNSQATAGRVFRDTTDNKELQKLLQVVPPPQAPRVLILGSSQVAAIKDPDSRSQSMPTELQKALETRVGACEVADVSAGGQSTVESMVVLIESMEALKPDLVVLGVSLFSMQTTKVRLTLLEPFDLNALVNIVRDNLPSETSPDVVDGLMSFRMVSEKQRLQAKGETIQQRIDHLIARQGERVSSAIRNRQAMYELFLDTPIRRDSVVWVKRHVQKIQVARTYDLNAHYAPSKAAIGVMSNFCKKHDVPLVIIVLPYDSNILPVPYRAADQARLVSDLDASANREGFVVADMSNLLGHDCFGLFEDGSPDGLHYRSAGHVIVGQAIADILAGMVRGKRSTKAAGYFTR
jgi:hypothetical protein